MLTSYNVVVVVVVVVVVCVYIAAFVLSSRSQPRVRRDHNEVSQFEAPSASHSDSRVSACDGIGRTRKYNHTTRHVKNVLREKGR